MFAVKPRRRSDIIELRNAMRDAQPILDLIDAFRCSKVMFAAVTLGIFDRLEQGPAGARQLAEEKHCDTGALERLLDACVALGLLRRVDGCYQNLAATSRYLRRDSPETLTGYILYSDRVLYRLWGHLEDGVREGTHRWAQAFGGRGDIFDELFATEELKRTFLAGMHGMGSLSSPEVVVAVDLSRFTHLCDVGGATGHLAIAACRHYPTLRATVFDMPEVVPHAVAYIEEAGLSGRTGVQGGDFFQDPLPEADLYAVGRILHDWSEEKIATLLDKVYRQLPAGGGLLIVEKILYPSKDGPLSANLQSLNMLVVTEGTERTAAEYEALVRRAGFREFEARVTGRTLDAMLALK